MRFLSVCSGIEAASVAWSPLGWECAGFSEVDPFACAVLAHHYHDVPNLGDMTRFKRWPDVGPVDLLVGGTPCQSFSVAGLRKGLADPRGNLALTFLAIADRLRPRWICFENVPGLLSTDGGGAFGAFLGGLGQLGYGFAYRVLDAQYFGVPQRRRRVFVVGYLGDWRRAAAVLFERACLSGDPPPRRETGEGSAGATSPRAGFGGNRGGGPLDVATAVNAHGGPHGRQDFESETFIADTLRGHPRPGSNSIGNIAHALKAEGADASEDGTGRGTPIIIQDARGVREKVKNGIGVMAFTQNSRSEVRSLGDRTGAVTSEPGAQCQNYVAFIDAYATRGSGSPNQHPVKTDGLSDALDTTGPGAIAFTDLRGRGAEVRVNGDRTEALHCAKGPSEQQVVAFGSKGSGLDAGEVAPTLRAANEVDGNANGGAPPAVAFTSNDEGSDAGEVAPTFRSGSRCGRGGPAVAFQTRIARNGRGQPKEIVDALTSCEGGTHTDTKPHVATGMQVRRLTPRECERLQGFPDDYTAIPYRGKPACDGPRYRALGNSMAVPVMVWIGKRIALVEEVLCQLAAGAAGREAR